MNNSLSIELLTCVSAFSQSLCASIEALQQRMDAAIARVEALEQTTRDIQCSLNKLISQNTTQTTQTTHTTDTTDTTPL